MEVPMELVLTGSYTDPGGKSGVRIFQWADGALHQICAADCPNPSFMVYVGGFLYAVSELPDIGVLSAYALDAGRGTLQLLNQITAPCRGLCHIDVTPDGKLLCAAAYNSGHVLLCDILPDGRLGRLRDIAAHEGHSVHPRQASAHAHQALADRSGHIWVSDLGLDEVICYEITPDKRLNRRCSITVPPGEGPRHAVTHPSLPCLYVLTELGNNALRYAWKDGAYRLKQSVALAPGDGTAASAELQLSDDGGFLYASVRGPDRIARMAVDPADGALSAPEFFQTPGAEPRMFCLSADGAFLFAALQNSGRVAVMRVDKKTGVLTDTHTWADVPNACFVQSVKPV